MQEDMISAEEVNAHAAFVRQALAFRRALVQANFEPREIAAMLGSFVLAVYSQRHLTRMPPEMVELMTKTNVLNDRMLAEDQ